MCFVLSLAENISAALTEAGFDVIVLASLEFLTTIQEHVFVVSST